MELEHYGRPTCSKLSLFSSRRVDRRKCRQQARPSTRFVVNAIDLLGRNFLSPEFETEGSAITDTRISLNHSVG